MVLILLDFNRSGIKPGALQILVWRTSTSMTAQLVLDAIDQAIWTRNREGHGQLDGLIHHNDAGSP